MPVIMRNHIPYGASNETEIIETTMDNYKSLESSNSVNQEAIYCIPEGDNFYNAKGILFDDSKTNLGTRNVQHALEKVNATAVDYFDIFAFQGVQKDNISLAKSTNLNISFDATKEGYTPIGILKYEFHNADSNGTQCSSINLYNDYIDTSDNTIHLVVRNMNSSTTAKFDTTALVMYVKNEYWDYFKYGDSIAV